MWTYSQSTGRLMHDGRYVATGYSGQPAAKNDPAREREPNVGPIPRGMYTIERHYDSGHTGPYSLPLHPDVCNEMFGRGGFLIHGDSKTAPGTASHGCIILPRAIREDIEQSGDPRLEVV